MIYTYKNATLNLGKYRVTGVSGESFVLSNHSFLCESVETSLEANVQPSYLDGYQFATDYSPQDLLQGSLNITYFLTGEDLLRDYFSDDESRISGNFGGLFFKEGKLASYSIAGQPNQPIKVNAEIVFFDQLSGTFTPTDTAAEEVQVPNFYNFEFTNNTSGSIGNFNILGFNYSMSNEIIPVKHAGSTLPDSLLVSRRSSNLNAQIDIISGALPVSGSKVDMSLDLKDFGGNAIFSLPITGVLNSRSISTSIDDIIRSNISIVSTQVSDQPTISSASQGANDVISVKGTNLKDTTLVRIGGTFYQRAQDNLTVSQLQSLSNNIGTLEQGVFSVTGSSNDIAFFPTDAALTDYVKVRTPVGEITSSSTVSLSDGGISVTGIADTPANLNSSIILSGSGFYNVSNVYFGGGVATNNFSYESNDGTKLRVTVPQLAESGFVTVKSSFRDTSGTSTVNFVPIPQITSSNIVTGTTGTLVIVSGFGLNHVTGALFGGATCLATSSATATSVNVTVPEDSVYGPITVSGAQGTSTVSDFNFTVIPLLTGTVDSSINPGDFVALTGVGITSNLLYSPDSNDEYLITFNGDNATGLFKRTSNQGLTGLVPANAIDGLITPNRTASVLYYSESTLGLAVQPPIITGISLKSGINETVALLGTNLSSATGMSLVSVRSNRRVEITGAYFKSNAQGTSFNNISYFSPDEGLQNIILKYDDPVKETTGSGIGTGFYYKTSPVITSFTPTSGVLGDQITLQGTGFYPASTKFYFKNAINSNLLNFNSNYTFLGDNTGVTLNLTQNLNNLFASNENNLITGSVLAENSVGLSTGAAFDLIPAPFISGFGPTEAEAGDTISVTGRSFINVLESGIIIRGATATSGAVTVVNENKITFTVPAGSSSGPLEIITTGGSFNTNQKNPPTILKVKEGTITISGFEPQPAFANSDTVTITGINLSTASEIRLSGFAGASVSIFKNNTTGPSTSAFKTDSNATSGTYIQFVAPSTVSGGHPLQLVNNDGAFSSSANFTTASISDYLIVYGYSGFGAGSGDATGFYGKEMVVTGSGFNSTTAVINFVSGNVNTTDSNIYVSGGNQTRLSDSQIKFTVPDGVNDSFSVQVSGSANSNLLFADISPKLTILPTITGVSGNGTYSQGGVIEISGVNNANFPWHISGSQPPALSPTFTLKDPNGADPSLGWFPTDFKIGITGLSFDGQKTVEYLADQIYIDNGSTGTYSDGQNFVNYNNGNLSFQFSVGDRFFGTGRLFLVHPTDTGAIFSGNSLGAQVPTEFFANATGFDYSATATYFNDLIFADQITINELEPTITSFSPTLGAAGSSVTVVGTNLKGVTGLSIFSGATESSPIANTSFASQTSTQISFTAPSFSQASGQIKLRTNSYEVNSTDYFRYAQDPAGGSIVPGTGQAGDTITVNVTAGLNDTEQLRLVTLDNITVTGSFTIVDDTQLTFIIPSEGRLPAPQDVDVQTYNGVNSTSVGTLVVREDSKDIFGDVVVSGNLTVSGFITGHGITGTSITATTGTFTQRPSVNGSGVLLVGEESVSAAGSDNQIQFNDGGSFGASSNLTWDDNGLYSNGYISGAAISGASFTTSAEVALLLNDTYSKIRAVNDSITIQTDNGSKTRFVAGNNYIYLSQGGTESTFRIQGTDVGIGTSSPSAKLHVSSSSSSFSPYSLANAVFENSTTNYIQVLAGNSGNAGILFNNYVGTNTDGRIVYDTLNRNLAFWTANTEKLHISSAGNIGVGVSSPSAKLHVEGDITGQAISGTSFHGPHFVSAPYSIGNTSGAVTIDFNNGSAQYATLNGDVTSFAASNVAAGESVAVQFTTTSTRTIAGGSTLAFIGEHPTSLSANMTGILSLMSFDGSTVVAGFAVQTGVA